MKRYFILKCYIIAFTTIMLSCKHSKSGETRRLEGTENVESTDTTSLRYLAMHGATMQIDPTFPYYKNRSNESIVEEIELAGYKAVHYFVVNENDVNGDMIDAFHKRGIPVWLMVVGNGTYSTKGLPSGWENWKMKLTKQENGGDFTFFSLFNKDFLEWKKKALVNLIKKYPFDGIEMAESYFPEWDAIRTGRYGDVGPVAEAAFKKQYKLDMPDFVNPNSPDYYTKKPDIYQKWIQFRVEGVNNFLNEIYNGKNGVREARPDILVATWSLAVDAGANSVSKLREDHGLEAVSMVASVKPDIHFFQTHWPDWIKPESQLSPDYMKLYQQFTDPVKTTFPKVPLGFQADQGSGKDMIKSTSWVNRFNHEVPKYGYSTWTSYEYHIGGYIYTETPKPLKAEKKDGLVIVSFNKRIDEVSGSNPLNYSFYHNGNKENVTINKISVDGNRALIKLNVPLQDQSSIHINYIEDTPALRLYKDFPVNRMKAEVKVAIL